MARIVQIIINFLLNALVGGDALIDRLIIFTENSVFPYLGIVYNSSKPII
jgi:hypothetical protein